MVFYFHFQILLHELTRSKSEDHQVFVLPHTDSTSLVSEFERKEPISIVSLDDLDLPQEPTNENMERSLVPYRPIIPIYSQNNAKKVPYHQFIIGLQYFMHYVLMNLIDTFLLQDKLKCKYLDIG